MWRKRRYNIRRAATCSRVVRPRGVPSDRKDVMMTDASRRALAALPITFDLARSADRLRADEAGTATQRSALTAVRKTKIATMASAARPTSATWSTTPASTSRCRAAAPKTATATTGQRAPRMPAASARGGVCIPLSQAAARTPATATIRMPAPRTTASSKAASVRTCRTPPVASGMATVPTGTSARSTSV